MNKSISALLARSLYGHISTINQDGSPYTIGVNLIYHNGKFYFHCGLNGKKLDNIRRDNRVCINIDEMMELKNKNIATPCGASIMYESVVASGRAFTVNENKEKAEILRIFAHKFAPEVSGIPMPEESLNRTLVVEINVDDMTFKEHGK